MPNRKVVFVVDDDPGTLRGVKRLLREHGYDSVLFQSAEAFRDHGDFEEALCIILDINLNDESGIEVRHRLKAAGISVPVIYITGERQPCRSHGGDGIRMYRLPHQAVLGEVADRAA